ncbi:Zinc finger FYVE domain-containing protein 1 [Fukomys damarensis]|uniref:Zinc finger FYVE domain-containing protein 1 n=1 Tax=Fukomys damarensis TaxID=885580 RepID=A0A091CV70_FUKDA|nr:Zinc finger FYVE domain-containing protein 1 [Fukomys damarensis]
MYDPSKIQVSLKVEEMDKKTKRKTITEKVVSFLLVNENEKIHVTNEDDFIRKFNCKPYQHLQVLSIFGNFSGRQCALEQQLQNSVTHSPWHTGLIFKALKVLSNHFSSEIPDSRMAYSSFPDEYFTCSSMCLTCGIGCKNSTNHEKEGMMECPNCGVVCWSCQHRLGNQDPVDTVVWPGTDGFLKDNSHAAQCLLNGMNFMVQLISELRLRLTKAMTS